jgi:hypothetical protein
MKLDKETLIKQRFWIALGAVVLLVLLVWIVDTAAVSGDTTRKRGEYESQLKGITGIKDAKNDKFTKMLGEKKDEISKQKGIVWGEAWNPQSDLMNWPTKPDAPLNAILAKAYFGDSINDRSCDAYAQMYKDWIESYYPGLVYPADYKGGRWESILRHVGKEKGVGIFDVTPPTSEECWLAQEDFWVQYNLLLVVRDVIVGLAEFHDVKPAEAAPKGALSRQRFQNANWELDLIFEKNEKGVTILSPKSTIKNVNAGHRLLYLGRGKQPGVKIALGQAGAWLHNEVVEIQGNALPWGKSTPIGKTVILENFNAQTPLQVVQAFDWYTSPVKRVDDIRLGYHAHKTQVYPLLPAQVFAKAAEATPAAPAPGAPGTPPSGALPGMPEGGGSMGMYGQMNQRGAAGAAGDGDTTPNGLVRNRYLDSTNQVRRMPVGMVLVIDQQYIPEVLAAFTNSRLRIQTTQLHWQHVHGIMHEASDETKPADGTPGGPSGPASPDSSDRRGGAGVPKGPGMPGAGSGMGMPAMPGAGGGMGMPGGMYGNRGYNRGSAGGMGMPGMPNSGGSSGPPGMPRGGGPGMPSRPGTPGGVGPGMPAGGGTDTSSVEEEFDPNLIELSIYGIASLYERFPAKADTAAASPAAPAPSTPAPPANP